MGVKSLNLLHDFFASYWLLLIIITLTFKKVFLTIFFLLLKLILFLSCSRLFDVLLERPQDSGSTWAHCLNYAIKRLTTVGLMSSLWRFKAELHICLAHVCLSPPAAVVLPGEGIWQCGRVWQWALLFTRELLFHSEGVIVHNHWHHCRQEACHHLQILKVRAKEGRNTSVTSLIA